MAGLVVLLLGTNDEQTVLLPRAVWLVNAALVSLLLLVVVMYAARQLATAIHREDALASQLSARDAVLHRLEEMANSDPLTGFLNRRALDRLYEGTPNRSAAALIDLDHFKRINDDFSHSAGDSVLVGFSAMVATAARRNDLLIRLGGDEFLVVRPDTNASDLGIWLQALREELHDANWPELPAKVTISFSAGVVNRSSNSAEQVVRRADQALYAAKAQGRDAIVVVD